MNPHTHLNLIIRPERAADIEAIARVTEAAFRAAPHSTHTESFIVAALRRAGQLAISLVAEDGDRLVGHVALSPVAISSGAAGWYGLGPISVTPDLQGSGIGSALLRAALAELPRIGGLGCVVLGEPGYYGRFGFAAHPGLLLPGVPAPYFQALSLGGPLPDGTVRYHAAFDATE
ncbi:GNAT family N-acetyltransferase [Burkholderia alba]|uniref:GNAT family N-acetyltransferase n=1 Tax=Burkholderia alba TaxID=2683677 RepID=UPI002B061FE7|nr:N-acetyltransferase [Burkholderia alba]